MRIGIDATNIGGGGGITHLKEILIGIIGSSFLEKGGNSILVYSSQKVLEQLPKGKHIFSKTHKYLNKSVIHRIYFQVFYFDKIIKEDCDVLFSLTGDYIGKFKPLIGISQNMLLYERNNWKEIRQFKEVFRFWLIFQKQRYSFNNSMGVIFLSEFAKNYITNQLKLNNKQTTIIHHGISPRFIGKVDAQLSIDKYTLDKPYKLLYVSTVHTYKHHSNVVKAIDALRRKGYAIEINLIGGVIFKPAGKILLKTIENIDPQNKFINYYEHIPYEEIELYYKDTDGIVFASTCENMPNILIESMASGKPIACSNKQPMPEFLKENGFYFDAYNVESITNALEELLLNPEKREMMAKNNLEEAKKYSWANTAKQTFDFINKIYSKYYVQK